MTISELIEELKSIKEEHGDLVVGIQDDDGMVQFDVCVAYFLENLFKDYEICINGEWQPFGVLEE